MWQLAKREKRLEEKGWLKNRLNFIPHIPAPLINTRVVDCCQVHFL
jgi:hypothetical protein